MNEKSWTVKTSSANLFVRQFGSGDRHLVLIHGGPGWDHSYFLPYVLPLAQNVRLTLFDLRDCGHSKRIPREMDRDRSYVEACVADLSELLDSLQISQAVLLGFSFGGRVAMNFAEKHPDKIVGLILASTTAYVDYLSDLECQSLYAERMTPELRSALAGLWKREDSVDGYVARQIALSSLTLNIFDLSLLDSARTLINGIQFTDSWMKGYSVPKMKDDSARNYSAALKQVSVPILLLHGQQDLVFPVSCATRLASDLAGSRILLKIVPHAGHLAHFEKPEDWNAAVLDFMAAVSMSRSIR